MSGMKKRKTPEGVGEKGNTILLEEKERNQLECKSDESREKSATKRKVPIVPLLLGFILGGIFGKLLILFLKIIGIL